MAKEVIVLKDVWKIYEIGTAKVEALRGITLSIKKGEFVAIQGPSGSGKSTAVNMIGCLDTPTRGKVFLDSQDISLLSESELAQIRGRKIGFVFQAFNLVPTLNALENVTLPMIFQNMPLEKREARAKKLLKLIELEERMFHRPSELSGGEQQRVAIARALANDPPVIIADEPTGNLDSKTGIRIIEILQKLYKDGKTIVMVTHENVLARRAERIVYLKDGMIVKHWS